MNIIIIHHLIPSGPQDQTAVILNFTDAPVKNKQSYLAKSCMFLMHSNFMALRHVSISYIQMHHSGTASVLKKLNWSISSMSGARQSESDWDTSCTAYLRQDSSFLHGLCGFPLLSAESHKTSNTELTTDPLPPAPMECQLWPIINSTMNRCLQPIDSSWQYESSSAIKILLPY